MGYSKREIFLHKFLNTIANTSSISRSFIVKVSKFFRMNIDDITIRSDKFFLDTSFYKNFIQEVANNKLTTKSNRIYYQNFKRLIYHGIIHPASSQFPKGLTPKSVNPVPKYLLGNDISKIDLWVKKRREVIAYLNENNLLYLYVYLRFFHLRYFTKDTLSQIKYKDIILIPEHNEVILYTEVNSFFTVSKVYRLIPIDKYASKILSHLPNDNQEALIFENFERYASFEKSFREKSLNRMKISAIKNAMYSFYAHESSHLEVTLERKFVNTVELTISELVSLFPTCKMAKDILLAEKKRLEETFKEKEKRHMYHRKNQNMEFTDIMDFLGIQSIMRSKEPPSKDNIDKTIEEVQRYMVLHDNLHANLIYKYLLWLLEKLKTAGVEKIRHSTFNNYVYILNRYIFRMIENLDDIQEDEVAVILKMIHELKLETQKTVIGVLRRFFSYSEIHNDFKVDFSRVHYPKSMIFENEIDLILDETENKGKKEKVQKFSILEMQMFILLGFYGGLRKNEIISRRIKDFIPVYDASTQRGTINTKFYIDVNRFGYKKIKGKNLKSSNAKRRINFIIKNKRHLYIIDSFISMRKKSNANYESLLFVALRKNGQQSTKAVKETVFNELNAIIQDVTKRYCTFHSLRHSFATYYMKSIIETRERYDNFFELNMQCGHSTSELTLNRYVHWDLIRYL